MKWSWLELVRRMDWILLGSLFTLSAIGLLMIYGIGVSSGPVSFLQFSKQFIAVMIGMGLLIVFAAINYRQLRSVGLVFYVVGLLLLIGVLIFGTEIRGTQGWFRLGTISMQPVELVKICFALFMAMYLGRHIHKHLKWVTFAGSFFAMTLYVSLILLQPDFGSAMVVVAIWLIGIAFAGLRLRAWVALIGVAILTVLIAWMFVLQPYQKERITSFMDPQADPLGAGYNVIQAQTAIGSGGWFGKGVGEGSQSRLRFLPEASTDFMFAVIGEELGFVGVGLVLVLFGVMMFRILWVGFRSGDAFVELYCVMITGMFGMHVLVNAGMNMGIMPVTGIPLPFASAAASSLVAGYLGIGVVLSMVLHADSYDRLA